MTLWHRSRLFNKSPETLGTLAYYGIQSFTGEWLWGLIKKNRDTCNWYMIGQNYFISYLVSLVCYFVPQFYRLASLIRMMEIKLVLVISQ